MTKHALKLLNALAQAIYDKKGFNILVLDVREICTMTDYFVIAEGTVDRHLKALSDAIIDQMSQLGQYPIHIEGLQACDWIVLDFVDFVVHLFTPELREKYALEELWKKGQIVDVEIVTSKIKTEHSPHHVELKKYG